MSTKIVVESNVGRDAGVVQTEYILIPCVNLLRTNTYKMNGVERELINTNDPPYPIGLFITEKFAIDLLLFDGGKLISREEED